MSTSSTSQPPSAMMVAQWNLNNSRLYALPDEILLNLNESLSGVDTLALRATSRKFRVILSAALTQGPTLTPTDKKLMRKERRLLLGRLDRDRACAAERSGTLIPDQLRACKACVSAHPVSYFSTTQLAIAEPEKRSCKGSLGEPRMCAHVAFRFHELEEMMEACPTNGRNVKCSSCFPSLGNPGSILNPSLKQYWNHGSHFVFWSRNTGPGKSPIRETSALTVDTFLKALADLNGEYICKHVRLDDPTTFTTEFDTYVPRSASRTVADRTFSAASIHHCRVSGCRTHFSLFWSVPDYSLTVTRFLGEMNETCDMLWLAQLEGDV